jgi:hypothetical protein
MTREEAIAAALPVAGWMSTDELITLFDLAASVPGGQAIIELGAYHGRSTRVLAAAAPHSVCAVDAFDASTVSDGSGISGDEAAFRRNMDAYDVGLLKMDVVGRGAAGAVGQSAAAVDASPISPRRALLWWPGCRMWRSVAWWRSRLRTWLAGSAEGR